MWYNRNVVKTDMLNEVRRKRHFAAEGVTLSGVREDKTVYGWRSGEVRYGCRRCKAKANLSGKRTEKMLCELFFRARLRFYIVTGVKHCLALFVF